MQTKGKAQKFLALSMSIKKCFRARNFVQSLKTRRQQDQEEWERKRDGCR